MENNAYKILVVDDNLKNIQIVANLLSENHYNIEAALSGEEALQWVEKTNFDLILLDIMMPEMDGFEVCEKLKQKKKNQDLPIIFLTAKTDIESISKAFSKGGYDYLTKPFNSDELLARVKTHVELKVSKDKLKEVNKWLDEKVQERTAQLHESNENLDKANKQLLVLDKAKNQFLMLISHEIRTPLNGIVGSAYFLNDMIDDPELKDFLDMLKESVDRLDKFSKTALEITQMQTVGRGIDKTNIQMNNVIAKVLESILADAEEKQCTIETDYTGTDSISVIEDYFTRAVEELVGNAVKFSNKNSVIRIRTFEEYGKLKFSVTDTGEVIPPEQKIGRAHV